MDDHEKQFAALHASYNAFFLSMAHALRVKNPELFQEFMRNMKGLRDIAQVSDDQHTHQMIARLIDDFEREPDSDGLKNSLKFRVFDGGKSKDTSGEGA